MGRSDKAEVIAQWKALYIKMRNVAAGYSNLADENGTSRRLDREFNECQATYERLIIIDTQDDYPTR
jgi:hypothetical protein